MQKYNGLRRRPTYDELIDYLHNRQETIRYPRRVKVNPYALLDDMTSEAVKRLIAERNVLQTKFDKMTQTDPNTFDKAIQTDPYMFDKSIQTDPYMFDKSTQKDDDFDYDKYFSGEYLTLSETVESYARRHKKTQTKRFERIIEQVSDELYQIEEPDNYPVSFGRRSLWETLFYWGDDPTNNAEQVSRQPSSTSSSSKPPTPRFPPSPPDFYPVATSGRSSSKSSSKPPTPPPPPSPPDDSSSRARAKTRESFINSELLSRLQDMALPYFDLF